MRFCGKVVGPDFFGPVTGADLAAAILRDRLLLLAQLHLVEPRPQHFHRLRAILDLRFLVLLRNHEAGRNMRQTNRRIGGVHALAAGSARTERIDAEILCIDLDVHLFGFGQDRHRGGGSVNAPARFGRRHPLHAVHAALVLQLAVGAASFDRGDDLLQAADAGVARRHQLDPPSLPLRVLAVHAEQLRGKDRRFVATGARANLQDDVPLVVGIFWDQQDLHVGKQRVAPGRERLDFLPRQLAACRRRRTLASSSACARSRTTVLYSRKRATSVSISDASFACFRNSDESLCTWAVPSSVQQLVVPLLDRSQFIEHLEHNVQRRNRRTRRENRALRVQRVLR